MIRGLERVAADRRAEFATQVRCATGFTYGATIDGQARLFALSGRAASSLAAWRRAVLPVAVAAGLNEAIPAHLRNRPAGALLAWLLAADPLLPLPGAAELGELLAFDERDGEPRAQVLNAFRALERARLIEVQGQPGRARAGERAVRVIARGVVLRTAGAPATWVANKALEGEA